MLRSVKKRGKLIKKYNKNSLFPLTLKGDQEMLHLKMMVQSMAEILIWKLIM